jgi:hypothetical protein
VQIVEAWTKEGSCVFESVDATLHKQSGHNGLDTQFACQLLHQGVVG